ncbi:LysR family transcriptional regulator [Leptospira interrogans]
MDNGSRVPRYSTGSLLASSPIEFKHLRVFVAVAELESFRKAAERLNISQSVVSKFISRLEDIVGVELFLRDTRNIEITFAGRELLIASIEILRRADEALLNARRVSSGAKGRLAVGYTDTAMMGELPSVVAGFRSKHPNIVLDLSYLFTDRQKQLLLDDELDIGFIQDLPDVAGLSYMPFSREEIVAVLPETHPLANRKSIALKELADEPFIVGVREIWRPLVEQTLRLCKKSGFRPKIAHEGQFRDAMFGMVAAGFGVTVYAGTARNGIRNGIRIVSLDDCDETMDLYVVWKPGSQNPSLRLLVSHLRKALGARGALR